MHTTYVILLIFSLHCAGQAHAQLSVSVYTFSDNTCQTPLTAVFNQPQNVFLSPAKPNGICSAGGAPCCISSQAGTYGPVALGFALSSDQTSTPTTCAGWLAFVATSWDAQKTCAVSFGSWGASGQYAGGCAPRFDFPLNPGEPVKIVFYVVVVLSSCTKPSLCTTCTFAPFGQPNVYYDTSKTPGPNGFCSTIDYKYCSAQVLYKFYSSDCEKSSPVAQSMQSLSCYTSCSPCVETNHYWLSNTPSNPGASGMCTDTLTPRNSSYAYYFASPSSYNQPGGCISAVESKVIVSAASTATLLFQLVIAAAILAFGT